MYTPTVEYLVVAGGGGGAVENASGGGGAGGFRTGTGLAVTAGNTYTVTVGSGGYYLIVAPNSTGCTTGCWWKTSTTGTSGTSSLTDGYTNTRPPMENTAHPAGNWTATRTINGFSDWYLPAVDELQTIYTNGGKEGQGVLPAGESYAAGLYWSSTEWNGVYARSVSLNNNTMYPLSKPNALKVRAIRREPI